MNEKRPRRRSLLFVPLSAGFFVILAAAGLLVIVLLGFDVLSEAYRHLGISPGWMAVILAAALAGSTINIPVATLRAKVREISVPVRVFGVTYRVPQLVRTGHTTVAVNVGGAIVPSAVAIYLICRDHFRPGALLATVLVTAVVFAFARPVPGVGIVTPALLPPAGAAIAAIVLGGHTIAAVAYVAGTFGTLVGADLLNLPRIRSLHAPVVSIGGAGTFDGVFLTGLAAVLLALLWH
jgi:uncharacterized membrane protein